MNEFLQRPKDRKLVQWTVAYVAAAFASLQGIDIVAQRFGWPEQTMRLVIIALSVGLFFTLVLAWYHGERGAQRVTETSLSRAPAGDWRWFPVAFFTAGAAFQIAAVYAWRGEKDQAFEWLDRAYDQHDAGMPRLRYDPTLASLHGAPRFAALVKKMGLAE